MSRAKALGLWVVAAVLLGSLQWAVAGSNGALDDPDPAYQRSGILTSGGEAPELEGVRYGQGPTLVIFDRGDQPQQRLFEDAEMQERIVREARVAVVMGGPRWPRERNGVEATVTDTAREAARDFGLRAPRDGGYPQGYAIVDSYGKIRYRTLDPGYASHADEVLTMLEAVR